MSVWNSHRIQHRTGISDVTGRPHALYSAPEMYGAIDQLCAVRGRKVQACLEEVTDLSDSKCDETIQELCEILMEENPWEAPDDVKNAVSLYLNLRTAIHGLLSL